VRGVSIASLGREDVVDVTGSSLDDARVAAAIDAFGLGVDVAEFHGGICGLLCARGPGAAAVWVRYSITRTVRRAPNAREAVERLHEVEVEAWRMLNDTGFTFYPMLPTGEAPLSERVAALALWCHGFVTGLGLGGVELEDIGTPQRGGARQLAEIVADFIEISHAEVGEDELEDPDQANFDLAELIEFVRAGAQLVFEELQGSHEPPAAVETAPGVMH
jgi:uncharacterized protein YgfB (UPF0149 family)